MARVAMLVSNAHSPDPRVEKEADALAAAGHEVTVYAFDRGREQQALEFAGPVRIERVSPPAPLPRNMLAVRLGLAYFHAAVRRRLVRAPAEILHCHDHDTCAVGLWWKRSGARHAGVARGLYVFDVHDLYWTWALLPRPTARWRHALAAVLRRTDRRFARAADLVITATDARVGRRPGAAELYREWGCDPVTVWNAPPAPGAVPPLPARFTVGYIGNVREPAMFGHLVDAIALLPPGERPALRIAGAGRAAGEVGRIVGEAACRLGIEATVSGAFHSAALPKLMAEVSVQYCVYPMQRGHIVRAMPVKLFEAVAHGRRVIGNADSLMGEWIRDREWGWEVPDGDVRALADAIRAAAAACAADGGRPAALRAPPLWPAEARRLAEAYETMLAA
jgi:glycosyltransferase involved in cell wall biosynthesis